MLAAVLHHRPALGKESKSSLPLSRQALQGWRKVNPSHARLPLHWELVAAMADVMCDRKLWRPALVTVIAFHARLRPYVAAALRPE
eukprot:15284157-Alexandrium_andersonii.AAC.1